MADGENMDMEIEVHDDGNAAAADDMELVGVLDDDNEAVEDVIIAGTGVRGWGRGWISVKMTPPSSRKKASNLLPAPVPPVPATPFSTADADALVHLWCAIAKDHVLAPVGTAALRALSVAVSQTVVERQFSVLSNQEVDNRLHGSVRYVRNLLILRCNGPYFDQYAAGRAKVLGTAEL